MKVAHILIKNFLSIGEVNILPGKITQITGANNQGKTSILKALQVAACGSTDGTLVKRGETEAEILVEFDDGTSINRKIKDDGKQSVKIKKGVFSVDRPQKFLDSQFGDGSFNPLDLLDAESRSEILLSAIPIKLTPEELKYYVGECPIGLPALSFNQHGLKVAQMTHEYFYQRRFEANRDAKAKAEIARLKRAELPELPEEGADRRSNAEIQETMVDLKKQIVTEQEKSKAREAQAKLIESTEGALRLIEENEIRSIDIQLARLEEQLTAKRKERVTADARREVKVQELEELRAAPAATGPDQARITQCNSTILSAMDELQRRSDRQTVVEKYDHVATVEATAKQAQEFADKLDAVCDRTGAGLTDQLIAKAELPIDGLAYVDGEFYLDETKIENLSSSAAMRLAVAVARAVAGPSKLICLDGAEALDQEAFQALREMIADDDFQYFITKVGEPFEGRGTGESAYEMRDGAMTEATEAV